MSKHTPGPWKVWSEEGLTGTGKQRVSICRDVETDDSEHVCVAESQHDDRETAFANARLVSTAPDGLALAQMVVKLDANLSTMQVKDWDACVAAARALIAKAGQ